MNEYYRKSLGHGQSGVEMFEQTKREICRHYKICGERAHKLMQATAEHFGGWDEVAQICKEKAGDLLP